MSKSTKSRGKRTQFIASGWIRRVNMEPIGDGRNRKIVCSAFLADEKRNNTQIYTDNPRFETALFAAYTSFYLSNRPLRNVEIAYQKVGDDLILTRIDLTDPPPPPARREKRR